MLFQILIPIDAMASAKPPEKETNKAKMNGII